MALVLHTSGTTSQPKLVPLSHANLCSSALNVARSLQLSNADRCLGVMPLFHVHGIVAALLASLAAGGSVACTSGYQDGRFLPWLEEFHPTWITAVPSIYQAILAELARHPPGVAANRLRFARSSSAPLPPAVMREMERALEAPVLEAYGMTEAAHQIACNPLPPGRRKPGSVGVAMGPEMAVLDDDGQLLPARNDRRNRRPRGERHARIRATTRKPMPKRSPPDGFEPATRAASTPTGMSFSRGD